MCEHGVFKKVKVKIPADLACEGYEKWKTIGVDSCIASIVEALQGGGIDMRGSCCGHGYSPGMIHLQDGRGLLVMDKVTTEKYLCSELRLTRAGYVKK